MSFINDLAAQRKKFLDGLDANEGDINLDIFEDFYPDQAHFIFELLQNAEDAKATEAFFKLTPEGCSFEHNGTKTFDAEDVRAITGIHNSTKSKEPDQIGKFGVGFKSVFIYSITPIIYSKNFSFKILRFVQPEPVEDDQQIGNLTRFEFPFNNPRKNSRDAYAEVEARLNELAETALLFLSNLESVRWKIGQQNFGEILRMPHSENHIEVLKKVDGSTASSSHFLRFSESVKGLEKQHISVAFALDYLSTNVFDSKKTLGKQLKIVSASPARVAVFFPAEKETSGLRFHLHAPFVPELSRSSIKDTPVNGPLYDQLAALSAKALHEIRDLDLLNADFLAVLPNPQDSVSAPYEPIRKAIIAEMNNEPLTPTHSKSHAPAKHLLQAKASLKGLLSLEDIEFLVDHKQVAPQWAIGATQRNSDVDRFLNGLEIEKWDVDEFVDVLDDKFSESGKYVPNRGWVNEPDEHALRWLSQKTLEWHQQFYSLLYRELSSEGELYRFKGLAIVRLANGTYSIGKKCYFPEPGVNTDKVLPRVDEGVFSFGKNRTQQNDAKKFLSDVGVRDVNEADRIQLILDQRYTRESEIPDDQTYLQDLLSFSEFLEKNPKEASRFKQYYIFETAADDWRTPGDIYLDSPFLNTNLSEYFDVIGDLAQRVPLANWYTECELSLERIVSFARLVGVLIELEIEETTCNQNPEWSYLRAVAGERFTSPINRDYTIAGLTRILENPSVAVSQLLWRRMRWANKRSPVYFQATYQKNDANGSRRADSQLIHSLRDSAWIPQNDGTFVRPCEADSTQLPEGFPFDPGESWLAKLKFGAELSHRKEDKERVDKLAIDLGFKDEGALQRAKRFASLPLEQQEAFLAEFEQRQNPTFPEHTPRNPGLRSERVGAQAANAPGRIVEKRSRSVSIGREGVKAEAVQYLKDLYTRDGEMFCQICKAPMPFKLGEDRPFFETVEFILGLDARHYQNYLALCPNHSAMFKYANECEDEIRSLFLSIDDSNEIEVFLAQMSVTIRFTETHICDLKNVIEIDRSE